MKIYIAACFVQQAEVRTKALELEALGHECTSSWRYEKGAGDGSEPEMKDHYTTAALCDLKDIGRSDVLLLLTAQVSRSGGKHVETGYALAKNKRVILVGPRRAENVFHWLVPEYYENWAEFLRSLS